MSALIIDEMTRRTPTRPRVKVDQVRALQGPSARPRVAPSPARRPDGGVAAPTFGSTATGGSVSLPVSSGWHLTDRGIAVVATVLLALCVTAAVVLVASFLSVSNEPPLRGEAFARVSLGTS